MSAQLNLRQIIIIFEQIAASYGKQVIIFDAKSATAGNNHVCQYIYLLYFLSLI